MKRHQMRFGGVRILTTIVVVGFIGTVGWILYDRQYNPVLSAEDIAQKFHCNRMTLDVRETDVFCGNPKFYNDPQSITKDDYYEYYGCVERLKGQPPAESTRATDSLYYNGYHDCKDATKLESLRQDFIKELERLKAESAT